MRRSQGSSLTIIGESCPFGGMMNPTRGAVAKYRSGRSIDSQTYKKYDSSNPYSIQSASFQEGMSLSLS